MAIYTWSCSFFYARQAQGVKKALDSARFGLCHGIVML